MAHIFHKYSIEPEYLFEVANLKTFVARARELSEDASAIEAMDPTRPYKDYQAPGSWSPKYFGSAIEFLAECYFQYFGSVYHLNDVYSIDDMESTETDGGIDHFAKTSKEMRFKGTRRVAKVGAPVYIQTKGTTNFNKEYKTNDGARIPNFFMNAYARSVRDGHAYQARFIIFTTGKNIHYLLDENSGKVAEVVNYKKISRLIDGNEDFFNYMRRLCGAKEKELSFSSPDPESECNKITNV